ncbi:MAG: glycosyltransferase family 39 protein [Candidatus Aminicenantes bacterium]|nr:glycosyltransferase family 39 protein [Candidatus Aminicenantes bacterium]
MKTKNLYTVLLIIFFLTVFSLRFIHLSADPPSRLSTSMGYIGDPGGYAFNARNKIIFGQWEMDMWNLMHISPLPHYMTFLFFSIFGPGIASMNLVPILFSCLILALTFILLRKVLGEKYSLLGTFLLGINYQFLMFSRIAVRVMPMLFFLLLTILFLEGKKSHHLFIFLAGISCFISFSVKGTALQFIPSIVIGLALYAFVQHDLSLRHTIPPLILFFLGITLTVFLWLIFFFFPHKEMFLAYGGENISWLTPHGFLDALSNFWSRPLFFFQEMPIVTILSTLYILLMSFKAFISSRKISVLEWICFFWIISNSLYFSVISYHAARHFIALVPPLVFLSLYLLRDLSNLEYIEKPTRLSILSYFILPVLLIFPVSSLFRLLSPPSNIQEVKTKSILTLGISLFITLFFYFLFKFWPQDFRFKISKMTKIVPISILIALSVFSNGEKILEWFSAPRFDIRDISTDLGKAFDKMVIAGLLGPVISLENRHEVHPYRSGYINPYKDFIQRFRISHLFVTRHAGEIEKKDYEADFPAIMEKAKLLARYPIGFTYAELYDIYPTSESNPDGSDIYEGELFFGKNGIPRFDPEASGKLAFLAEQNKKAYSFDLPLQGNLEGNYTAVFRLKASSPSPEEGPLFRLSVIDSSRKKILASKDLSSRDFDSPGKYQDFTLSYHLKNSTPLYLRITTTGKRKIWVDKVAIKMQVSSMQLPAR